MLIIIIFQNQWQSMSWAVNQNLAYEYPPSKNQILVQRTWSCAGITPCEQSSEAVSLLLNRMLSFAAPGYSSFPWPHHRTTGSQKHGEKMGRLVGFAAQQFPSTCKVWRSSLVRWRGETGLVHPPGVTQDSSSEPSAAQSSRRKTENIQVLPPSPPRTGTALWPSPLSPPAPLLCQDQGTSLVGHIWHPQVSRHSSESFQFLKVKLLQNYSSGLYATPYPQGDEGLHFGTAGPGNTYRDSGWDMFSLRPPSHYLLFSWEGMFQYTTWIHVVK